MSEPLYIGHTRFSLFTPNYEGWRASNGQNLKDANDYQELLFNPERLEPRSRILLENSLPLLEQAAGDRAYKHVISFSSLLPAPFKLRLQEARDRYPFVVLDEREPGADFFNPDEFASRLLPGGGTYGVFRLDDDDLLAVNYFTQMDRFLRPGFAGMRVSLASGLVGLMEQGSVSMVRSVYKPKIAIGLMGVNTLEVSGRLRSPRICSHDKSDFFDPVILFSAEPSYLWMRHVGQDTNVGSQSYSSTSEPIRREMEKFAEPPSDVSLKNLFPAASALIRPELFHSGHEVLTSGKEYRFNTPTRSISIAFSGSAPSPVDANSVLFSFDIARDDGSEVDQETSLPLVYSPAEDIGWYLYMPDSGTVLNYETHVQLPEGVVCRSVTVYRWNSRSTPVEVTRLEIKPHS